jgi:glutamate transport system permease protein
MASVLFDEPGPRARVRHRLYTAILAALLVAVMALVIAKLNQAEQFEPEIFEKLFATNVWNAIRTGILHTLQAAVIAMVLSVILGTVLAVGRLSEHAWLSWPCVAVVEFFRAVPLLLMIFFIFIGFASSLGESGRLIALIAGLTLYNGSVLAEVFRAGILAVPKGQSEAAYAIGMRKTGVMSIVLIPQAVKFMLPAIISQCVVALKDTSLGYIIAYSELLREGKGIAQFVGNNLMTYLLIAVLYIAINAVVSLIATWLERRSAARGRGVDEKLKKVEAALELGT